jgi:hypothetical protein
MPRTGLCRCPFPLLQSLVFSTVLILGLFASHTVTDGYRCEITVMGLFGYSVVLCSVAVVPVLFRLRPACVVLYCDCGPAKPQVFLFFKSRSFEHQQFLSEKGASLLIYLLPATALDCIQRIKPLPPLPAARVNSALLLNINGARDGEPSLHHCAAQSDALPGCSTEIGLSADGGLRLRGELADRWLNSSDRGDFAT